jgi:hypothetical protein
MPQEVEAMNVIELEAVREDVPSDEYVALTYEQLLALPEVARCGLITGIAIRSRVPMDSMLRGFGVGLTWCR